MRTPIFALLCALTAALLPAQKLERDLYGRVIDEAGEPIAGVAVCLIDSEALLFVTEEAVREPLATTAADGSYRARLPDGRGVYRDRLLFVARGRVHVSTPLHPHDGWPVVLPRAHTLAGRVVDAAGEPVANVRVEARDWLRRARYRADSQRLDWLPEPRTAVRTDARGRFVMPGTVAAGVELIAGDGLGELWPVALGDAIEIVVPERAATADAAAKPVDEPEPQRRRAGASTPPELVEVRAVDADGGVVEDFRCAIVPGRPLALQRFEWIEFERRAVDSADGVARPVARPDTAKARTLLATAEGMAAQRVELDGEAGTAQVAFAPEAILRGEVVDAGGQPIVGAELWVATGFDDNQRKRWRERGRVALFHTKRGGCTSDATGAFTVRGVAAGAQHLFCRADGFVLPLPVAVEPAGGQIVTGLRIELTRLAGLSGKVLWPRAPVLGASIVFVLADQGREADSSRLYDDCSAIAADGSFHVGPIAPGEYTPRLVLPRGLQQGAPDLVDLDPVTIDEDGESLTLDARAHVPAIVRGVVTGSVPTGRLLVGASVERPKTGHNYGFAYYECALATVGHDGSYRLQAPPGTCRPFVIDLRTGMLLLQPPPRELDPGADVTIDFEVAAGACDVELRGIEQAEFAWLEMLVPDHAWPKGIDRMNISNHKYTKRIGCFLRPREASVRLYLPAMAAELWLVDDRNGQLDRERGEVSIAVRAGETGAAVIELPR